MLFWDWRGWGTQTRRELGEETRGKEESGGEGRKRREGFCFLLDGSSDSEEVKKHPLFPDSIQPGTSTGQDSEKGRRISTHSLIK